MTSYKGLVYVCVASEFNVAEFESCLLRRPEYLVLVVSDYRPAREGADRLEEAVEREIPGTQIIRTDHDADASFDATRLEICANWARTTLASIIEPLCDGCERALNITGGNKTLMLALLYSGSLEWDWLDYKPLDENSVERFSLRDHQIEYYGREPLPLVSPRQVARLYNRHVEERRNNPLSEVQGSLGAASEIWDALWHMDAALLDLFTGLEKVWSVRRDDERFRQPVLSLSADTFIGCPAFGDGHLLWLKQWCSLCPDILSASLNELRLPGNDPRGLGKALRRWLSGDWLEQLVYHWLEQSLTPEERDIQLARNLVVNPSERRQSDSSRETDILLHRGGRTTVIEIKADLPPGQHVKQPTEQVSSLADRLGKTGKILFAGPQFVSRLRASGADYEARFQDRCQAAGVRYVTSREGLYNALGLTG